MYKNILLPVDGSDLSQKAVNECVTLVKGSGAKVAVVHVVSHFHLNQRPWAPTKALHEKIEKDHEEDARRAAQEMVDQLAQRLKSVGIESESLVVVGDQPYEEIINQATTRNCDLIVMASHGHMGLNAVLLGSETVKVLTHSKIPVLVVR
jgi:nucleotide-binding universal stress UspA family protein